MTDINHVITLGIGEPGDIEHFILLGLNGSIVFTGLRRADVKRRVEALDAQEREAMYLPSRVILEDDAGWLLFEDGNYVMWETGDAGTAGEVKRRIENLDVNRNG